MSFDGFLVPDWAKPYVGWVVGMDWPEGDESGCFRLADACVTAAHAVVKGSAADQPWSADKIGSDWDGDAHLAFAEHVSETVGGQVADTVNRLINAAVALNGVGMQIQYAKYMIEVTVWLLILQLSYLLTMAVASGGASLALIPARVQLARMTVAQIAQRTVLNIAIFAGIVAGMDAGVQLLQMAKGRRDELDLTQIGISALSGGAMGGLMGLLSGGLSRLATPALRAGLTRAEMGAAERLLSAASSSLYGQAAQYAVTGGLTTAGTMLAQGNFDWDLLAKGVTSSALGADGQHLSAPLPHRSDSTPNPYGGSLPDLGPHPDPGSRPDAGPRGNGSDQAPFRDRDGTTLSHATDTGPARQSADPTGPPERQPLSAQGETRPHTVSEQGPAAVRTPEALRSRTPDQSTPLTGHGTPDHKPDGASRQPGDRQSHGTTPHRPPERPSAAAPHQPPERETGGTPHQVPERTAGDAPRQANDRTPGGAAQQAERGPGSGSPDAAGRGDGAEPTASARSERGMPGETPPTGRIERLLNHAPDSVPDPDGTTPTPPAARAPGLAGDGTPVPPFRPSDTSAGPAPGRADARGGTPPRVPFGFERFLNDPRWSHDATGFEQRLGAYYFNDPQTVDAARAALGKLRDVLMSLTPRQPGESPAAFARRVDGVFFKDDPSCAGQVGTRSGVTVDDLLAHGNLRELVTAFYNGAYYNRANPNIFGKALLDLMDARAWDRAGEVGLDVGEVRRSQHQLDERWHRPALGRLETSFRPGRHTFARDPFGTGNVGMLAERGARDVAEMISSQYSRRDRSEAEIQELGLNTTPGHYERVGAPLGRFESAFVEEHLSRPLDPGTPLTWREGVTIHDTTGGRWARQISSEGFPVVDGISGTTAKMLTAVKFLDLGPGTTERFLGALMGWMLPGRNHSLFEVARGAQIADVGSMRLEPGSRPSAVDFYRSLPGVDLATLRREVLPDGMFPHESRYFVNARDSAGFSETQHPKVGETVDRLWPQLESGRVTDPDLAAWLDRSGIDAADPAAVRALGDRLSPAHVMALTVYTRHSHYLINNVTRTQLWTNGLSEPLVRNQMVGKVNQLVGNYLDNLAAGAKALPLPLALRPLLHVGDGHLNSRSPLNSLADAYVDAGRRIDEAKDRMAEAREESRKEDVKQAGQDLREARREQKDAWNALQEKLGSVTPKLWDEMRWHADMVHDAMAQLPGVGSPEHPVQAYRGDWMTPVHSPIYGSKLYPHGTAREFLSVSKLLEVAIRFMVENPAGDRKVLVAYQLVGQQAKDISIFSSFAEDQEAVFPPRSRMHRVNDPELDARLRAEVSELAADMVERGVIPEAPSSYEIIVMEES
ncbi:hypothetical protein [Nonomuraea sp. B5E05]|uniref:WXG100-like domain-containing protein n=1 Tax=Nonomuraea sp. B5E05 TaxID=3153569 RepID=UPI0032604F9C